VPSRAKVSAVLVRPLVQALEALPEALDRFWRATDLTPQMVADPEARVSPAQFCVAWAEATRLSGDPALALRIAETTPPGAFGVVEYLCRAAPTLRDALTQWVRYLGILDDSVEVGLVDLGADVALRVTRESEAPAPASHELCFALVVLNARNTVADGFSPVEVRFRHLAPQGQMDRYRGFFGASVRFEAEHTELVFPRRVLDAPLMTADPNLLAVLLPAAEAKRERSSNDPPLTDQIRSALRAALSSDDAELPRMARQVGLTARSLQRRLRDEGTSFQALRDETRLALADRYLGQGLSAAEISFLLGFSEPSAFFRAFKRWTVLTPIERRAAPAAGAG
jgi:AraC-like DNA-binding protein